MIFIILGLIVADLYIAYYLPQLLFPFESEGWQFIQVLVGVLCFILFVLGEVFLFVAVVTHLQDNEVKYMIYPLDFVETSDF